MSIPPTVSPSSAHPLLELRGVSKSFGAIRALRSVDLDVQPGEIHALLGENGAGKSTLIKVVTGAHQPDEGSVIVDGQPTSHLTPATARALGIACIYQQPALFPDLTVAENISLRLDPAPTLGRVDWKARYARAQDLLAEIGAEISPAAEVRFLPLPARQLVEIACVVGSGARILLMDEPTASLTRNEQHLLFGLVRRLRERGAGILYISHRLEEIFALADRVTVLRDGQSVGTTRMEEATEAILIRRMIGREMTQLYPAGGAAVGDPVLSLRGVGCAASGVHDVSFEVRAGEVLGLAGLVGAGRTELAHVLFGLTPADAGEIRLRDRSIVPRSPRQAIAEGIAYVPEDRPRQGVVPQMSVAENVTLAVHPKLFRGSWLRPAAEHALTLEYIRTLAVRPPQPDIPVGALSGGNQQKVAVARWLATNPRLLILDEPTQGVDVGAKSEIHHLIRRLTAQGMAVLLISSDLPEVLGMSDRIGVMRAGTLVALLPGGSAAETVMAAALGQQGGRAA